MKKSFKGFIMGLIAGLVISCICVGAVTGVVTKELHYNDIKVTLNGQEITPKDANGNVVEPFIIDGTTYLPVRAVANALGLDVNWDGETNTVKLGKDSGSSETVPTGVGSVIYDKNGIKITYQEVKDDFIEKNYIVLIENNSAESVSMFASNFYVNGFAMSSISDWGASIDSGKKAVEKIRIRKSELEQCGISKEESVEFDLKFVPDLFADEKIIFKP